MGLGALLFNWLDVLLLNLHDGWAGGLSGEHVVVKGPPSDGNEVMMGTLDLGDEDGLGINVGNNFVGVVGKFVDPPRN
jgi:hypothetical protein